MPGPFLTLARRLGLTTFRRLGLTTFQRLGLTAGRCPVCGSLAEADAALCAACAAALPLRRGGFCPACGEMSGREADPPSRCPECRLEPPPWESLHFHGRYSGLMRDLIVGYKFRNRFDHNRLLGAMAVSTFETHGGRLPDIIIPVPLHARRLTWRGFNQSVEIARGLGSRLKRPVLLHALERTRNTPPQTRLGLKERQTNIRGAFKADPALVKGKVALLVDDVYTTGSTLREGARTLRGAGCTGVDVLVLARAQREPDQVY